MHHGGYYETLNLNSIFKKILDTLITMLKNFINMYLKKLLYIVVIIKTKLPCSLE